MCIIVISGPTEYDSWAIMTDSVVAGVRLINRTVVLLQRRVHSGHECVADGPK